MKFREHSFGIAIIWLVLIGISLFLNYRHGINEQKRIAFVSAKSLFDHIVLTRRWNASHGGVYVPETEETPANPYLKIPLRDLEVDGLKLTMMNPSYMTRQISELVAETEGIQIHLTSNNPIRPENKPTELEEKYLKEFEGGLKEVGLFPKGEKDTSFFYMAPLITEKSCLVCHSEQGYKEGDIRGGISVTLPFIMEIPFTSLFLTHLIIGLLGVIGIIIYGRKINLSYKIIKTQAIHDDLTGLLNRRSFLENIIHEFKRSERNLNPLAAIMCDLDNFKAYNDTYGHIAGDLCIKKVAQGIKEVLNRPGDFCARYGGEEFVIVLPDTTLHGAMTVAEKIRVNIEELNLEHKESFPLCLVTLSLGVAIAEENNPVVSSEELIKHADMALYKAKEQGRNQVQAFS